MNIDIKPIEWSLINGETWCYEEEVRKLEAKYKEAIEALKEVTLEAMNTHENTVTGMFRRTAEQVYSDEIGIIEKATGNSWKELTE